MSTARSRVELYAAIRRDARAGLNRALQRKHGMGYRTVVAALESAWPVAIWLGEGVTVLAERGAGYETTAGVRGEARSFRELDRVRLTWQPPGWTHDTTLQLAVSPGVAVNNLIMMAGHVR